MSEDPKKTTKRPAGGKTPTPKAKATKQAAGAQKRSAAAKPAAKRSTTTQAGAKVNATKRGANGARKTAARGTDHTKAITLAERWQMVSDAAYYMAEQRGFFGGDPSQDWLEAERLVDERLRSNGTWIMP